MAGKFLLLGCLCAALAGCGSDTTVTVGDHGQKGIVVTDIERSRAVAHKASDLVRQSEKDQQGP